MNNKELMDLARELGQGLQDSNEYKTFCEARDVMRKNTALKALLDEFKVQKSIYEVEKEKPDADEHVCDVLSARLDVLYKQITENPDMIAFTKAEEDINILVTAVNMTVSSYVGEEQYTATTGEENCDDEFEGGCVHDCSRCHGCH